MLRSFLLSFVLLLWTRLHHAHAALKNNNLSESTMNKIQSGKPLTRKEQKEVEQAELEKYQELRRQGYDEVSNTKESTALRNYRLRKRKRIGLFFHKKRQASLSQVIFPGSTPTNYNSSLFAVSNLILSRRSLEAYDISMHPAFQGLRHAPFKDTNLGAKLEGYSEAYKRLDMIEFNVKQDVPCTVVATTELPVQKIKFLRQLVQKRYRMHLSLDKLPMLMRSRELNYAVKGMPVGFEAPQQYAINRYPENLFLYNHWRFTVTYHEDPSLFEGVRITGFDVHPVSIAHNLPESCSGNQVENNPDTYLSLPDSGTPKTVTFSYQIDWVQSELIWDDRWDVYFLGLPDVAIHYYSMLNSVICMVVLAAVIATALIRVFRKDLAGGTKKDNGWKHLRGDVFRKPESPMLLSIMVGNGAHILVASLITMILNICHVINTMVTGDALTGFVFVYALTSSLGGYVSARLYKLCGGQNLKRNALLTSTVLSGSMVLVFCLFNMASDAIGSSCSDSLSVAELILLWGCISVNLCYLGAQLGERAPCIEMPANAETNDTVRPIPNSRWMKYKKLSVLICGMICFGVLYVELHFLMTAIWLNVTYLGLGYMLTVTLMVTVICAECTLCVCYYQLNSEDHEWWWTAFWNGASVGGYIGLFALNYRFQSLELVGFYSNLAYFTCMFLATVCIGMVCGSIGFLSCLWFTRTMYSAINSDDTVDEDDEEISLLKDPSSEYSDDSTTDADDSQ
ncbi:unnamed protein product [Cylindrotheca closterium]|uniref:Transmembrane 9 superfamily member n=1 Tax=Cylindrotheca closterium TaxID=2856 RepID=A0AAD2G4Q9_9STRA|nr:unnamed protein product [Cylindrotheca closterium]